MGPPADNMRMLVSRAFQPFGAASLAAVTLLIAGCSIAGPKPTSGTPREPTSASQFTSPGGIAGCAASTVHTGSGHGSSGLENTGVPWIGNDHFIAVLFFARPGDETMRAGGSQTTTGTQTKILWWAEDSGSDPLVIHGHESRTSGDFTQSVDGIGGGQYPSIVNVPTPGCWTLTETVGNQTVGAITIPVMAAVAKARV